VEFVLQMSPPPVDGLKGRMPLLPEDYLQENDLRKFVAVEMRVVQLMRGLAIMALAGFSVPSDKEVFGAEASTAELDRLVKR